MIQTYYIENCTHSAVWGQHSCMLMMMMNIEPYCPYFENVFTQTLKVDSSYKPMLKLKVCTKHCLTGCKNLHICCIRCCPKMELCWWSKSSILLLLFFLLMGEYHLTSWWSTWSTSGFPATESPLKNPWSSMKVFLLVVYKWCPLMFWEVGSFKKRKNKLLTRICFCITWIILLFFCHGSI